MRASRLLAFLMLLQVRQRVTAQELAREFGLSERTVYRDIAALESAGLPLLAERGPGGGFRLLPQYRSRVAAVALASPGLWQQVLAAAPEPQRVAASKLGARFHLDPADWYRRVEVPEALTMLAQAVTDNRRIAMNYRSWTGTRPWRLDPLGLVLKGGRWYVVGTSKRGTRIFNVSQIERIAVLRETGRRPPRFDLASFWQDHVRGFEQRLRAQTARLRASEEGLRRIGELGVHGASAVAAATAADASGWRCCLLPIEAGPYGLRELLGLGAEIEVLEPAQLRQRLRQAARDIVQRHID
jgi:predicted DNA-binding transcriptional regulator YafY